jgi:hypothetical protein
MSKRPRKPATLWRYLRTSIRIAKKWNELPGDHRLHVDSKLGDCRAIIAELSRAIATSGKAPGR